MGAGRADPAAIGGTMTIETLKTMLENAKFDVSLGKAPKGTMCPYVVIRDIEQPNFAADNKTYIETTSLQIRLVESEVHDWALIDTLKGVLDQVPLTYSVTFIDDSSEHVCETYFDIRFLGGIKNA